MSEGQFAGIIVLLISIQFQILIMGLMVGLKLTKLIEATRERDADKERHE